MQAAVIAIPILVVLALVVVFVAMRRRDTGEAVGTLSRETVKRDRSGAPAPGEQAVAISGRAVEKAAALERRRGELVPAATALVPWTPPTEGQIGVARRQFLNRSIVGFMGLGLSGFGASCIAFLWPGASTGFGSKIKVGNISDVLAEIRAANGFLYRPEGRMWLTEYPPSAVEKGRAVYGSTPAWPGIEAGVKALYQKCPHLGCRVPECLTSQWFECPCHGSQYNQVGEKRGGPAPRGMDFFAMEVDAGVLTVDTGNITQGPPIGTNTTGQEAEGAHCLSISEHE